MKNQLVIAVLAGAVLIAGAIVAGALLLRSDRESTPIQFSPVSEASLNIPEMQFKLRLSRAANDIMSLANKVKIHHIDNLTLPESLSELKDNQISKDLWGNPYNYAKTGDKFRIWSNGPDGQSGTEDDIESNAR